MLTVFPMKRRSNIIIPLILCLLLTACGGGGENAGGTPPAASGSASTTPSATALPDTWQFDRTIPEPIELTYDGSPVTLGNFATHGIEISVPEGAFESAVTLTLSQPEEGVRYNRAAMDPAGVPAAFRIEGDQLRSDLPMTVKLKVDAQQLTDLQETGGFRGGHFDETFGWTYVDLVEVNETDGYLLFNTYHNWLFAPAKLTREERVEQFAKEKALDAWGAQQMGNEVENVTREMIREIMIQQFNATNESEIMKIADAVIGEIESDALDYGKMALQLKDGDYEGLVGSVADKLGGTLASSLESGTLETLFGQAGTAAAAAGHLWEGDYSGAGMKIAEAIAESSPVYRVAKVWIDMVDTRISNWKNDEVEKAYQIYINGAQSRSPWGYNVDAGDFESLYSQMRGVSRQLELEAVDRYAKARGISTGDITAQQRQQILADVKAKLKDQFEKRSKQEEELRQLEEDQREIIRQFEEWGLLREGSSWYPYDTPVEQMLHRLHGQMERIMRETGRYDLVIRRGDLHDQSRGLDNIGELKENELLVPHLAELISTRYVEGEEAYQKKLLEFGYITLKLEPGTYVGELVITDVPMKKALQQAVDDPGSVPEYSGPNEEMCEEINLWEADVQASVREAIDNLDTVKGTVVPLRVEISPGSGENSYTAVLTADFASALPSMGCEDISGPTTFQVRTDKDKLTLTHTLEDGVGHWSYEGTIAPGGTISGNLRLYTNEAEYRDYVGTDNMLTGTWEVSKQ
ncbi:hypothetical protein [Anoxynatronum buryatiense]|uniref:Uncharacterized protein n=1 Tax=Anoxynatronum buryatiense TaxID=489973 RepID=A0AA45WV11_9CLOT|nr:hypothetical protein [Anoxynatronum buryatiense]SMP50939.1 hypothetical protein SAMN06296020_10438 [Anoxynatronum buryatiense]